MFHLALAQAPADLDGVQARLDWLAACVPEVAAKGADLLLLPEFFACGYNIGAALAARAETRDGAFARSVAALARTHGLAIHYGYAERDGDRVYSAAQCIGPDGDVLGHHRKLAIPPGFEQEHLSAGQGCALFRYRGLRIGMLICYDIEFVEPARHVAALGADLVLVPTALGDQWGWVSQKMVPVRAYENGVYLAYANSAGVENGLGFLGQSFVAAPKGQELARAGVGPEILYAKIDPEQVRAAQARLPYLQDRTGLVF